MTRTRTRTRSGRRTGRRARPLSAVAMAPLALVAVLALQGCDAIQNPDPDPTPTASDLPSPTVPVEEPPQEPAESPTEPSASPVAAGDPCGIVSQEEAETLADSKLNPAAPLDETCTYTGLASGPSAQVEVYVGDSARSYLDAERGIGHELSPLSGIGEEAYLEDGSVFFRTSEQWISIRLVRSVPPAETRKPLEDLARTVAARL
ncbi:MULTISPECIES: hypothetical protein [unclassified Streptomyces]|uniref:hypothetical protein n=1 Tax=unclassified Streptomyces TaxID=2593676 RepID=UPI001928F863|nr:MULTISPECIES: hypothetical protein [unclassified Streptomyces]